MSERGLDSTLVSAVTAPIVYPAMLFDLTFAGMPPPFPGQFMAWSLPTTVNGAGSNTWPVAYDPGDLGNGGSEPGPGGTAVGTPSGGVITMSHINWGASWMYILGWSGFTAPVLPAGATVTGIYPVLICSHAINDPAGGNAYTNAYAGVGVDPTKVEPSGINFGVGGGPGAGMPFNGAAFPLAEYYGASIGTDITVLPTAGIYARLFQSMNIQFADVFTITGVGFAVYYTPLYPVVEPVPDGSNTYHVWAGLGSLVVGATTYTGVGTLGKVTTIGEGTGVEAKGITLTLSGIDPAWLAESLTEINLAARAVVSMAFLNPLATSTSTLVIDSPIVLFTGIMDGVSIDSDANTCSISIDCEPKMVDLNRSRGGRFTDQDQKARYPLDNGLQWTSYNIDSALVWKT